MKRDGLLPLADLFKEQRSRVKAKLNTAVRRYRNRMEANAPDMTVTVRGSHGGGPGRSNQSDEAPHTWAVR